MQEGDLKEAAMDGVKQLYTQDETIDLYVEADEKNARQYFGERYVKGLRSGDILGDLEGKEVEYGFREDPRYDRLRSTMSKRARLTGGLINGKRGESNTAEALGLLRTSNRITEGVNLCHEGKRAEIDFVVTTKKRLYLIESKYSTTDVTIDEYGLMRNSCCGHYKPYSVGEKMRTKEQVLSGILESALGDLVRPEHLRSMLVFSNDGIEWDDQFGRYPICRCGNLAYTIEDDEGDDVFTDEQMDLIDAAIREASTEPRYPLGVDLDQIDEDLAHVMELIASKDSNDANPETDVTQGVAEGAGADTTATETADNHGWSFDWRTAAIVAPVAVALGYGISKAPNLARKIAGLASVLI